jgi:hypothetical protein
MVVVAETLLGALPETLLGAVPDRMLGAVAEQKILRSPLCRN